jgi:ABC-type multidrug transport system ATPase subunit
MLLDEPFAGIDPIAVADIQQLVRHLTQRGIGVLITDHNVRETLGLIDRAYIIHAGEVLTHGRADDRSSPILTSAGSISARALRSRLRLAGLRHQCICIKMRQPSFDAFAGQRCRSIAIANPESA